MAINFKNATAVATTTLSSVYTCPANTQAVIHGLHCANVDGAGDVTISIALYDSSKTTDFSIVENIPIPVSSTFYLEKAVNLEEGDQLKVSSGGTTDVEITLSILERS